MMPVFPSGGRLTVNSDLTGCCVPLHGLFAAPAPLAFAGAETMGGLTLAFDLSARLLPSAAAPSAITLACPPRRLRGL